MPPLRVQLGTSRLENLDPAVLEVFLDKSWVHLGDVERKDGAVRGHSVVSLLRRHSLRFIAKKAIQRVTGADAKHSNPAELYERTNFEPFYYQRGDRLRFEDNSVSFIYSEHFFEHLHPEVAMSLLQECRRMLEPGGVIRTCVPDAELRTYEKPEPVGYPDPKLPWEHPLKHKLRWTVYSLIEALEAAGYDAVPLHYCDRSGEFIQVDPRSIRDSYQGCTDEEMIHSLKYVFRPKSLIVDGIKR